MITLPIKYLKYIFAAVTALRKVKAFNANMFWHVGIGSSADAVLHNDLMELEVQLQTLTVEARRAKSKTVSLSVFND